MKPKKKSGDVVKKSDYPHRDRDRSAKLARNMQRENPAQRDSARRGGDFFGIFEDGEYREEMPKLFGHKLFPATVEHIMAMQWGDYPERGELSFHEKFSTSSGIAHAPAGKDGFKIIPYYPALERVDGETLNYNGGIKSLEYEAVRDSELTSKDMPLNVPLTEKGALEHVGLLRLVRGDIPLWEQIVGSVYKEAYDRHGMEKAIGLYVKRGNVVANVRPISIRPIEAGYGITDSEGWGIMDKARLVGLRNRAQILEELSAYRKEEKDGENCTPRYKFRH